MRGNFASHTRADSRLYIRRYKAQTVTARKKTIKEIRRRQRPAYAIITPAQASSARRVKVPIKFPHPNEAATAHFDWTQMNE
jgi:hypothetical protein